MNEDSIFQRAKKEQMRKKLAGEQPSTPSETFDHFKRTHLLKLAKDALRLNPEDADARKKLDEAYYIDKAFKLYRVVVKKLRKRIADGSARDRERAEERYADVRRAKKIVDEEMIEWPDDLRMSMVQLLRLCAEVEREFKD